MEKYKYKILQFLCNQLTSAKDAETISHYLSTIRPGELIYLKYKLVYTLIYLMRAGICNEMVDSILPEVNWFLYVWKYDLERYDYNEELYEVMCEFHSLSQTLFENILINTSWEINIITEMKQYEDMPDSFIKLYRNQISIHWGAINESDGRAYVSKRLSKLGCSPELCVTYYPYSNVYITNSKVNDLLKLVKNDSKIKRNTKYKKIVSILSESLFYRISNLGKFFIGDSDLYYECYLLGEAMDTDEFVTFYHLDYGHVVEMLLVDSMVDSLLDKYRTR